MPLTRGFTDEIKSLNAEPILGVPAGELGSTTLGRIAKFQDAPLRLYASATPDAILHIAANKVQAGDGTYRATPPSNSTLPTYAGSTINFDTAAITGGTVTKEGSTFALPTLTGTGKFVRMAFAYNTTANAIDTTFSAEAASQGALVDPGTLYPLIPGQKRGYIDLVSVSAANKFKTATSAGAVPLIENADIITFGSGSASDGSGGGASLLDPNYDETFIYYTRSDFAIDQKKFFGSTTGTDSVLGLGKVVFTAGSQTLISSNLLGTVFLADAPVVNTAQVRLLYNVGKVDSAAVIAVALDGAAGSPTWVAATKTEVSGLFVIADFVFPAGSTSTDTRVRVTSSAGSKELAGFGVNLCQDSTGSYAGDATKEVRTITSTEASTGLITLASVRFTPGAGQLHCNYKGHDFIEPDFICLGAGAVQFPMAFFTTGDVAKFWVGYGLVNLSNVNIQAADTTTTGLITPTAQDIGGVKTFYDGLKLDDAAGQSILNYYATGSVSAVSGSFTAGTLYYTRVGNMVTLNLKDNLAWASSGNVSSASSLVPSGFRPTNFNTVVAYFGAVNVVKLSITSAGLINIESRDWTGALYPITSIGTDVSISYLAY